MSFARTIKDPEAKRQYCQAIYIVVMEILARK